MKRIREVVEGGGGFEAQLAEIEALAAYRGGNWTPLVERFFRSDRPTMFKLARILTFVPTSRDRTVLDALEHAVAHRHLTRELIPASTGDSSALDLSFASQQWRTTVYAKDQPGMLLRRHFEAMVFTYLVESSAAATSPWPVPRTSATGRRCCCRGSRWSRRYHSSASRPASRPPPTASWTTCGNTSLGSRIRSTPGTRTTPT
ncbi:hypothetical protein ACWCQZ_48580 [Streptomyces sp. NPDC002285]